MQPDTIVVADLEARLVATVQSEVLAWPDRAKALAVETADQYQQAAEFLKGLKSLRKKVADTFGPLKQKAHASWKAICAEEQNADAPLDEAERIVKRSMAGYDTEQERLRREEQRRLEALARQLEETERLAAAAALEATGSAEDMVEAQALLDAPAAAVVVPIAKATPKVDGISMRDNWKFEIVDATKIPREYCTPDLVKIGGVVRAMKGAITIPGVRAYNDRTVSAGSR